MVFAFKPGGDSGDSKELENQLAAAQKRISELEQRNQPKVSAVSPVADTGSKGAGPMFIQTPM